MLRTFAVLFLILITTGACTAVKNFNISDEFEKSSNRYNRMLRWREMDLAGAAFAAGPIKEEFAARVKAAENVTITDYRIKSQYCIPEKNQAEVIADIDYFVAPSITVKTVQDIQKWEYVEENGKKSWRLVSLLPEFK
jgi:hypothetical protein